MNILKIVLNFTPAIVIREQEVLFMFIVIGGLLVAIVGLLIFLAIRKRK